MEEKELILDVIYSEDYCGYVSNQGIYNEEHKINFGVSNLSECPEDAIIERDLFSADDYIKALNKGIELAKKGYTKVSGNFIKEEEE